VAKDAMLLYGKNSVLERLKLNPASIKKIFLQEGFNAPNIEGLIKKSKIPQESLSSRELERIKRGKDLQGIVARVDRFEYIPYDDLLDQADKKKQTIIFLDRINDPHNLGVIIRTVACFGGFALVIPKFEACDVNETVLHVASGGENYLSISKASNLSNAIIMAKKRGYWIAGAIAGSDAKDISSSTLPFPLGLVLGSEGGGIRYGVEKHLDIRVKIPMKGAKLSFNVNIACAILCHEIAKQKGVVL